MIGNRARNHAAPFFIFCPDLFAAPSFYGFLLARETDYLRECPINPKPHRPIPAAGHRKNQIAIMEITSTAFKDGEEIPDKHTFDGENLSPPLRFGGVPADAQSLALIVEDIDSPIGPFTHWVVWNMPPQTEEIGESALPREAETGINGFGEVRYGGPCPPSGRHRYRFRLIALDTRLEATAPDRKDQIESEMEGNVLAEAILTGLYQART